MYLNGCAAHAPTIYSFYHVATLRRVQESQLPAAPLDLNARKLKRFAIFRASVLQYIKQSLGLNLNFRAKIQVSLDIEPVNGTQVLHR